MSGGTAGQIGRAADLFERGEYAGCAALCREILADRPHLAGAWRLFGMAQMQAGDAAGARQSFLEAGRYGPVTAALLSQLGEACRAEGDLDAAVAAYQQAVERDPESVPWRMALATLSLQRDEPIVAEGYFLSALARDPVHPDALAGLTAALIQQNRIAAAKAAARRGLEARPDHPGLNMNLGVALLAEGDYESGFRAWAWRWQTDAFKQHYRDLSIPWWSGEPLAGRTLFVRGEQGVGDQIQFARFVPMLAGFGASVVFETYTDLHRLFAGLAGRVRLVPMGTVPEQADFMVPVMSLGGFLPLSRDAIPGPVPYLSAPPAALPGPLPDRPLRIGLVFGAKRKAPDKSCPLSLILDTLSDLPVTFYSLQKGDGEDQVAALPADAPVIDMRAGLGDFHDTAAAMTALDAVISVDTAAAHLAGALARPLFVLLLHGADWRWQLRRSDSPWYPTAELVRQPAPGDWNGALVELRQRLIARLSPSSGS